VRTVASCSAGVVAAGLIVAACTSGGPQLETLAPPAAGFVEACPEALFGPVVVRAEPDRPGVVVAVGPDRDTTVLVWDRTYSATFDPLRIHDAEGRLLAAEGDPVWLTGGSTDDDRYYVCGASQEPP
jgi:hypothetical protein